MIRYHSLGDVILTTGIVRALSRWAQVEVATEERFFPVFQGLPEVGRLWAREEMEAAAGGLRFERVIDLQGTPGSRTMAARLGPARAVRTRSLQRRWVVFWGDRFPRPRIPHAIGRYAEAAGLDPEDAIRRFRPVARPTMQEEEEARRLAPGAFDETGLPAVALLTGASRRTKAYPADQFLEVARRLEASGRRALWVAPPNGSDPGGQADVLRLPLGPLKAVLARAAAAVACDSGPMHLATALGVPVVALFGSSVAALGFRPVGAQDQVLQVEDLACRPCGVHGRNACWMGHWRCLRDLSPQRVVAEVGRVLEAVRTNSAPAGRKEE